MPNLVCLALSLLHFSRMGFVVYILLETVENIQIEIWFNLKFAQNMQCVRSINEAGMGRSHEIMKKHGHVLVFNLTDCGRD